MAGHSKWKNNLHRKSSQDAKKSANFGKLSRAITIAVLEGGSPDPNFNPRLRVAIEKAKEGSMPKDNIERAIAKGSGPDHATLHSLVLEIFAPGNIHIIALATTDNPNRTHGEIRSLVERNGGKLGSSGSVAHFFSHCVNVSIKTEPGESFQEKIFVIAEELQADDMTTDEETTTFFFPFANFGKSLDILNKARVSVISQPHIMYKPLMLLDVPEKETSSLGSLVELLEEHDDIHEVFLDAA